MSAANALESLSAALPNASPAEAAAYALGYSAADGKNEDASAKRAKANPFTVYYWPMFGRGGAAIRMLLESGAEFDWKDDFPSISSVCAAMGADSVSFAPPVIVHGDVQISQSTATAMYVGQQCGFPAPNDALAMNQLTNLVDLFENNIGKNNEDG